jgi:nascent polypeptide-associated complex subunit alpha
MARQLTVEESSIYNMMRPKLKLEELTSIREIAVFVNPMRYTVDRPVVYKVEGTDSIVVFGTIRNAIDIEQLKRIYEAKIEENKSGVEKPGEEAREEDESGMEKPGEEAREAEDKDGVREEDVSLIQSQISATREEIVQALLDSGNDVVTAMVKLSK